MVDRIVLLIEAGALDRLIYSMRDRKLPSVPCAGLLARSSATERMNDYLIETLWPRVRPTAFGQESPPLSLPSDLIAVRRQTRISSVSMERTTNGGGEARKIAPMLVGSR